MEHRNINELRLDMPGALPSCSEKVLASPMTQLAMNFESICTRTPTGASKCTPRRKLSLADVDNNAATPILTSISRTLSNESGYCPSPDRQGCMDSPSADFISYRKRSFSKVIRRPNLLRSTSSPHEDIGKAEENCGILEDQFDENNNKENEFQFVKPTMPAYKSTTRLRPTSCPPELSPGGSSLGDRKDSEPMSLSFSIDEDDDGFVDYTQLEQIEDETFTMSSTVAGLITAPLTGTKLQDTGRIHASNGNTPKCSGRQEKIRPCDLFQPITCNFSPDVRTRRSKSLSMKRPVPPRDPSPEVRKKLRGRCSSAQEASWNSPLLVGLDRVPAKSPLTRSLSVVEPKSRRDIDQFLTPGRDNSNLTGDFSKANILTTIAGQHQDLKTITPEMVTRVLDQEFNEIDEFFIVDCRYPYEYGGGHIRTAMNLHTKEAVYDFFMTKPKLSSEKRTIVIFHCEFSSKRAPNMYRYLRNKDRDSHKHCYPKLFYPEMYVIQGGYKAFFETCKEYCEPQTYTPMAHENFAQELKRFSKRSKSWTEGQTARKSFRKGIHF